MKRNGFTVIELMIVIAIIGILAAIVIPRVTGYKPSRSASSSSSSFGTNGYIETRCIEGYKFVIGHNGNAEQIMDSKGNGVRCQQ